MTRHLLTINSDATFSQLWVPHVCVTFIKDLFVEPPDLLNKTGFASAKFDCSGARLVDCNVAL